MAGEHEGILRILAQTKPDKSPVKIPARGLDSRSCPALGHRGETPGEGVTGFVWPPGDVLEKDKGGSPRRECPGGEGCSPGTDQPPGGGPAWKPLEERAPGLCPGRHRARAAWRALLSGW